MLALNQNDENIPCHKGKSCGPRWKQSLISESHGSQSIKRLKQDKASTVDNFVDSMLAQQANNLEYKVTAEMVYILDLVMLY